MQVDLPLRTSPPRTRGGRREGAGRPRQRGSESHRRRPEHRAQHPLHVTIRVAKHVWNLRAERCFGPIRRAFHAVGRHGFRVVHYSVQGNHLHLLVETAERATFSRGLRALVAHLTHALHRVMGRGGPVLASRTHARALRTRSEVRNALRYVLLNHSHHVPAHAWIDECSTAPWFSDWDALGVSAPRAGPRAPPSVSAPPTTWLLRVGYRP